MILDVTVLLQTNDRAECSKHRDDIINGLTKMGFQLLFTSDGTRVVMVEGRGRPISEGITQYMQEAS